MVQNIQYEFIEAQRGLLGKKGFQLSLKGSMGRQDVEGNSWKMKRQTKELSCGSVWELRNDEWLGVYGVWW